MMERRNARGKRQAGAGDHDLPYSFGMLPSVDRPHPFRLMQYARLLFMRGRLLDGAFHDDREGQYQLTETQGVVWVDHEARPRTRGPLEPD